MKKLKKSFFSMTLVLALALSLHTVVNAQGTTSISVSKSSIAVGDSTTVSVTASESGTVTVKYTASYLTLTDCTASGYSSEGNSVTFSGTSGDLVFEATGTGTASIIVSSTSCSGSSCTLTIGSSSSTSSSDTTTTTTTTAESVDTSEDEVAEEDTTEETVTASSSTAGSVGTLNSDGGFDIDGVSYVVSERYSDSEIPSGFSKTTITIGSSTYSELTNDVITLVYLKPADNTSGSGTFYIYDADAGTVSEFIMLTSADSYVILTSSDSSPYDGMTEITVTIAGDEITGYTLDGSEFIYVYGINQNSISAWYVYDYTYGTLSRVDDSLISELSSVSTSDDDTTGSYSITDTYVEKLDLFRKIISALVILCVILVFVIINMAMKRRSGDDFDGDDIFAEHDDKSKPRSRIPRSIVFREAEDEDDDYDEDEDDYSDDNEDEDEYDSDDSSSPSYESSNSSSLNMMDLNDL